MEVAGDSTKTRVYRGGLFVNRDWPKEILSVRLCRGDAAKWQAAELLHVPFEEDESKLWGHLDTCGARIIEMGRNCSRLLPVPAIGIPGDRLNTEHKIAQPRLRRARDTPEV